MTFKLLSIASVVFGVAVGAAYAQTATTDRDIQNSEVVGPMYTDNEMTQMRSKDEMKAAWDLLPEEKHTKIKGECANPQNDREKDFCGVVGDF
ncbi:hypothetical protein [Pseudaminobacter soli (ex Li et al. 2025)]|uniref:Uncharacterized protein n=1 Tax=Pseudaminobacter soli (ex Li et al. 2025) TaxID=1295366 RepID=A0A2P7RZH3_9HYPH|nr:hypothetical protein [Mesorhizobium soli]PSJ55638.1 hypothetical protein C7I85_26695 [Mesorhizobium soli]